MTSSIDRSSRSSSITQNPYAYYQDAVRILAQLVEPENYNEGDGALGGSVGPGSSSDPMTSSTSSGEHIAASRRFSVDPQLTNFEVLKNLVARAFDVKGDFAISYRVFDDLGSETYLPLVSDWDLSAAFLSASEPDLQLLIEPKNIPLDVDEDAEETWDIVQSTEVINNDASHNNMQKNTRTTSLSSTTSSIASAAAGYKQQNGNGDYNNSSSSGYHSRSNSALQSQQSQQGNNNNWGGTIPGGYKVWSAVSQLGGAVNQYPIGLNSKINTTGLFNTMEKWVQKAKTFVEDLSVVTTRPPLNDVEFRNYLDPGGVLCRPKELRYACYHGGIEPGLRKVVWKHLLNIYPDGLSGNARIDYVRNKAKEYYEMREIWSAAVKEQGRVSKHVLDVTSMVRKDVLRTDRHHPFFAGPDDSPNISSLYNILTTYALNHPSVGYCQGMSDLASPLLVTLGDEAQAYVCFTALMVRIKPNFNLDGLAMSLKFAHLSEALAYYDGAFWSYLKSIGADDLLFCYRWLLLEMKREFNFEDCLRMMEVMWATLPYKPSDVPLYEVKFTLNNAHSIPLPLPSTLNASYTRVCAIRRSSTSISAHDLRTRRLSRKPKANPLSLDESSLASMSSASSIGNQIRSHTKPFYSLDETGEMLSSSVPTNVPSMKYPLDLSGGSPSARPRMVKNLKEFWTIGKSSSMDQSPPEPTSPVSSSSSLASNFDSVLQLLQNCSDTDTNGQVFYDDYHDENSPSTVSESLSLSYPHLPPRSRHSSSNSMNSRAATKWTPASTATSISAMTRNSSMSLYHQDSGTMKDHLHHNDNIKSDVSSSDNTATSTFQHNKHDEGDVDIDSGHGMEESLDVLENSLQEPEFSKNASSTALLKQPTLKMPSPDMLGGGNPFLMFLCLTLLLQHRDHIIRNNMDYNETAMYFDKMIRKHNVARVLGHARMLYSEYLKQHATRA